RDAAHPQTQPQFAAEIFDRFAIAPPRAAAWIGAPDGKFPEHPIPGVANNAGNAALSAAPGRAHDQSVFIHGEHDAAALLAALENVGDVAVAQPDGFRLGDYGYREQI